MSIVHPAEPFQGYRCDLFEIRRYASGTYIIDFYKPNSEGGDKTRILQVLNFMINEVTKVRDYIESH